MSNPDSFIQEVTEEVRRDKLYALLRRYGWIAVLLLVIVVGGAAWNEWRKARDRAAAQAFGDAVLAALEAPDAQARQAALAAVPADGARAALIQLFLAAEAERAGDTEAALTALAAIEMRSDLPVTYRQIAGLKRVLLGGSALSAGEREQLLSSLAQPGGAFRPLALEQLALLRVEAGETDAALAILRDLLDEPDVTQGLRLRVQQLIVALGGEARTG